MAERGGDEAGAVEDAVIHQRGTFDEERETVRTCPCGRHWVAGHWTRPYCPFAAPQTPGRYGVLWLEGGDA